MKKNTSLFSIIVLTLILLCSFIDLDNLFDYENQTIPSYITQDNTNTNTITNEGATLGRVLFYDKNLSSNNTIACASCHLQERAFGDTAIQSIGVNGVTGRHSMRLINSRFTNNQAFFWDQRADSLEEQTTMPIKDHIEMGYSGQNGDQNINELITQLSNKYYYPVLFNLAFGDSTITEERIQFSLAQFIRSIQSFDSKFDIGYTQSGNDFDVPFTNFTALENEGKALYKSGFSTANGSIGFSCNVCHAEPHFSISPVAGNNGIISIAGTNIGVDLTNTKSPSIRDLVNADGTLNTPLMHDGSINSLEELLEHYETVTTVLNNPNLHPILSGPPVIMTTNEKQAIIAFLKTLTGTDVYTNERWSDPFNSNGVLGFPIKQPLINISVYPNPVIDDLNIQIDEGDFTLQIFSINGKEVLSTKLNSNATLDVSFLHNGIYILNIREENSTDIFKTQFIKTN
jgi:cytochrome c peroxidase